MKPQRVKGAIWLLAGGTRRACRGPDSLLSEVMRSTGVKRPRVAYLGAASGDDAGFLRRIAAILRAAGAGPVVLAPTADVGACRRQARDVLWSADLVFVSGGDVAEGMRVLKERGLSEDLNALHGDGKPFCGMSAGSIMLGRAWVRWADPDDECSAESFPCLGLAPLVCDTHAEAEEWVELKALLRFLKPGAVGYGIPAGGALTVGSGGVVSGRQMPVPRFLRTARGVRRLAELAPTAGA